MAGTWPYTREAKPVRSRGITTGTAAPSSPISLHDIRAAQQRLAGSILRTPLVRLNVEDAPAEIYLKLENLQPIGSFKLRGAGNAMAIASPEQLAAGVYTASAGNMALGGGLERAAAL